MRAPARHQGNGIYLVLKARSTVNAVGEQSGQLPGASQFTGGYEIEPFPAPRPSVDAPARTYPDPPRVALSPHGYRLEGRYTVPLTGEDLQGAVRRAVSKTGRLGMVDIDSTSAHIANRAIAGIGYESIVLRFVPVSDTQTRIDGLDESPVGTVNTRPGNLPALLRNIADEVTTANSKRDQDQR